MKPNRRQGITYLKISQAEIRTALQITVGFGTGIPIRVGPNQPRRGRILIFRRPIIQSTCQIVRTTGHIRQFQFRRIINFITSDTLETNREINILIRNITIDRIGEFREWAATIHTILIINRSVIICILETNIAGFGTRLNQNPIFLMSLHLFRAIKIAVSRNQPKTTYRITGQRSARISSSMNRPTGNYLRFCPHFHHFVFIISSKETYTIGQILIQRLIPSQIKFKSLITDLTCITNRIISTSRRNRNRHIQQDIFRILYIPIGSQSQTITQGHKVNTDIRHRRFFPFDIRIGKRFWESTLYQSALSIRIINASRNNRHILIVINFLIT